jgi:hypothetical protein
MKRLNAAALIAALGAADCYETKLAHETLSPTVKTAIDAQLEESIQHVSKEVLSHSSVDPEISE